MMSSLRIVSTAVERSEKEEPVSLDVNLLVSRAASCATKSCRMVTEEYRDLGILDATRPYLKSVFFGYYIRRCQGMRADDPLLQQLQHGIDEHFLGERHAAIWRVAEEPEEAIDLVLSTPLWDPSVRKFAAI